MGFLERLRHEKVTREEIERRDSESRLARAEAEAQLRKDREGRVKALEDQARTFFIDSSFIDLGNELAHLINGAVHVSPIKASSSTPEIKFGEGNVGFAIAWDKQRTSPPTESPWNDEGKFKIKTIIVTVSPNGTINVTGGVIGSTNLSYNQWSKNPDVKERALERAYKHPLILNHKYYRPIPQGPG